MSASVEKKRMNGTPKLPASAAVGTRTIAPIRDNFRSEKSAEIRIGTAEGLRVFRQRQPAIAWRNTLRLGDVEE